ncbi:uncharacterized protein LOC132753150 [Ruditapes philippinarum]|uniref:uncharacterized protein LOC132753150 n=1 Tax=Ruditapes philippinarum TaxID=129788 RepID=UPI00295A617C|nr:uncharacterized protein LOC132753150 [Ruditapes philippinarum]
MINIWIFLLTMSSFAKSVALLEKELFIKDVSFSNLLCPLATIDLGLHSRATKCASACSQKPACRSFFYNKHDQLCKGAPGILTSTAGCALQSGTLYFHTTDITTTTSTTTTTTTVPSSQYGRPCTGAADCTITYGKCLRSTCECQAGYSYKSSTDSCVSNCGNYGSTYSEYLNVDLAVTHSGEYHFTSLARCHKYCSDTSSCRGVNYSPLFNGGMCRLKSRLDPTLFVSFNGINFYTRNCA